MSNIVFIATSLDGYIADKNNGIDWLHTLPVADDLYMEFEQHMENVDALVMGRNTYELVASFDMDWPYRKPVFVLSNSLSEIPFELQEKVSLITGELNEIVVQLKTQGFENLYIDGGITIQHFLAQDLIDEMIITTIPIVLGGGIPLFGTLDESLMFKCIASHCDKVGMSQQHFVRQR